MGGGCCPQRSRFGLAVGVRTDAQADLAVLERIEPRLTSRDFLLALLAEQGSEQNDLRA